MKDLLPFSNETKCDTCLKSFVTAIGERRFTSNEEIGSISYIFTVIPAIPKYCPFCGDVLNPDEKQMEQIGKRAAKTARTNAINGHSKKPRLKTRRIFGLLPTGVYKHEKLVEIFGPSWRKRIKDAREKNQLNSTKEGSSIFYVGADVIAWRESLEKSQ